MKVLVKANFLAGFPAGKINGVAGKFLKDEELHILESDAKLVATLCEKGLIEVQEGMEAAPSDSGPLAPEEIGPDIWAEPGDDSSDKKKKKGKK